MKKSFFCLTLALLFALIYQVDSVQAATLAQTLSGRILLDVQNKGEAWYVDPSTQERYFLGRPTDAFAVMRKLGVGINNANFQKIAQAGTTAKGDLNLTKKLSGKIILEVEKKGEAWYVNPVDLKKYYLGKPADAFAVMRKLGLGIKSTDLAKIPRDQKDDAANSLSNYKYRQEVKTDRGGFYADVVEVALGKLSVEVVSDTAGVEKCSGNCPTKALYDFVFNHKAFAAVGGYSATAPFYNTLSKVMMNGGSSGPLIAFDENNKFYYFSSASGIGNVGNFEVDHGAKLSAAFGGGPRIIEDGVNVLKKTGFSSSELAKTYRSAFGFKKSGINPQGTAYLVTVRNASLADVAAVLKGMGMDYAVLLASGDSPSLYYNKEYKVGPGSNQANAVLFSIK